MAKKPHTFEGKKHSVSWDKRLCIHVGECGRAKGALFEAGRKPWCDPDLADTEEAAHVVQACPSGALVHVDVDGNPILEPAPDNAAHIANDGPVYLTGDLSIKGAADDMPGVKRRAALCRCGASKNKPFCDNSHREIGFKDAGAIGETGAELAEADGELAVQSFQDGPLELKGNLTMYAGSGRKAWQGRKVYLCRCGASNNKPFCDGSHKDAGFKAD
ncbi:MAG: hypothetical protein EX271_06180 [Acidimicrobiales bacterium]|nr:hypothetical protein [Hyphomonadaceae bacterium]RZV42298.1 MAG: hypothetical protein EX271_06180 [Acidimicrobiales bacterium]